MNVVLVTTAVAVVAGAIVAVSSRDARFVLPGLGVCLVLASLVADPLPDLPPFLVRAAAGLLAIELLWIAVRHRPDALHGSFVGWPATVAAAGAAAAAGYAVLQGAGSGGLLFQDIGAIAVLPIPEARAAGFALIAISAGAVLVGRDLVRLAIASMVLLTGVELVRTGVVGPPGGLEHMLVAAMVVALPVVVLLAADPDVAVASADAERTAPHAQPDDRVSHANAADDTPRGRAG